MLDTMMWEMQYLAIIWFDICLLCITFRYKIFQLSFIFFKEQWILNEPSFYMMQYFNSLVSAVKELNASIPVW